MALPALRRQMICHTQRYENCVWPEPKFWIRNRHLRVASDFSGMEAPVITMRWCLKLALHHTFSSETNLSARKLSDTLFKPDVLFGDVRSRIPDQPEMEDNDMYFASAPCQPFSSSGKGLGTEDRDGLLIFAAITYMVMYKPIMALFEQVPLTGKHKTLLEKVEQDIGNAGYIVESKIVNCRDYGLPQNRPRLYIQCIRKAYAKKPIQWPTPIGDRLSLSTICTPKDANSWLPHPDPSCQLRYANAMKHLTKHAESGVDVYKTPLVIDIDSSTRFCQSGLDVCPTLTRARCESGGWWVSTKGGTLDLEEMMMLQGFNASMFDLAEAKITRPQMAAMVGNSIPTNVLSHLIPGLLNSAGYISDQEHFDMIVESGWY